MAKLIPLGNCVTRGEQSGVDLVRIDVHIHTKEPQIQPIFSDQWFTITPGLSPAQIG